jgi:hypothetical protein
MSRKFQDENFLVWEVYPSASRFGFSHNPHLVFNCLTDRLLRPRSLLHEGDEADAERVIVDASRDQLMALLRRSTEIS